MGAQAASDLAGVARGSRRTAARRGGVAAALFCTKREREGGERESLKNENKTLFLKTEF